MRRVIYAQQRVVVTLHQGKRHPPTRHAVGIGLLQALSRDVSYQRWLLTQRTPAGIAQRMIGGRRRAKPCCRATGVSPDWHNDEQTGMVASPRSLPDQCFVNSTATERIFRLGSDLLPDLVRPCRLSGVRVHLFHRSFTSTCLGGSKWRTEYGVDGANLPWMHHRTTRQC